MDRKGFSMAIAIGMSALAIAYVAAKVDWGLLRDSANRLHLGYIPLLIAVYMLGHILRGVRWMWMLQPVKKIPVSTTTGVVLIGYMANNLLPFRLGEFVRAFLMGRISSIKNITLLSSIGAERVMDGLTLLAFLSFSLSFAPAQQASASRISEAAALATLLFVCVASTILLMRVWPQAFRRIVKIAAGRLPNALSEKAMSVVESILESLEFVRFDWRFARILGMSLAVWLTEAAMFYLGLFAFDFPASIELALFTLAVVNLGVLIPSAPGYVGIFQLGTVAAFSVFGLSTENATVYSVVIHLCQYLPVTLTGLFLLTRFGYSFQDLANRQPKTSAASNLEVTHLVEVVK